MNREKLSVAVITLNEEKNLSRCLESVQGLADEVVVLDSGSTDNTVAIARRFGAVVVTEAFAGHIEQKNKAIGLCNHPWVLSLDADEALSPELKTSLQKALIQPKADAYAFNRLSNYCGKWIRHGGWYPDTKTRLFKKDKGCWKGQNPHDSYELFDPNAKPVHLKGDLYHYSYYTTLEHQVRIEKYALIAAQSLRRNKVNVPVWKKYLNPLLKFFKFYVVRFGFLDGKVGFTIAWLAARETFLKYHFYYVLPNASAE